MGFRVNALTTSLYFSTFSKFSIISIYYSYKKKMNIIFK